MTLDNLLNLNSYMIYSFSINVCIEGTLQELVVD